MASPTPRHFATIQVNSRGHETEEQSRIAEVLEHEPLQRVHDVLGISPIHDLVTDFTADACRQQGRSHTVPRHIAHGNVAGVTIGKPHLAVVTPYVIHWNVPHIDPYPIVPNGLRKKGTVNLGRERKAFTMSGSQLFDLPLQFRAFSAQILDFCLSGQRAIHMKFP